MILGIESSVSLIERDWYPSAGMQQTARTSSHSVTLSPQMLRNQSPKNGHDPRIITALRYLLEGASGGIGNPLGLDRMRLSA